MTNYTITKSPAHNNCLDDYYYCLKIKGRLAVSCIAKDDNSARWKLFKRLSIKMKKPTIVERGRIK